MNYLSKQLHKFETYLCTNKGFKKEHKILAIVIGVEAVIIAVLLL